MTIDQERVNTSKFNIRQALSSVGVNVPVDTPLDEYPPYIVSASSGGGGELPPVTSEDNGDVLTVVNGEWDKATPSGGSGTTDLIVTITENWEGNVRILSADVPYEDVYTAIGAGRCVRYKEKGMLSLPARIESNIRADIVFFNESGQYLYIMALKHSSVNITEVTYRSPNQFTVFTG